MIFEEQQQQLLLNGYKNNIKEDNLIESDNSNDLENETKDLNILTISGDIKEAKYTNFTNKETLYFKMIDKFFKNIGQESIQKMLDIINGKSIISLRLLDWFVTHYANKYNVTYELDNGERFNVYISYKAQLKSYKKRYFDPFRRDHFKRDPLKRKKKFIYCYNKDNNEIKFYTTICQLNFFRWAFSNDVIKYVENNYDVISKAMIKFNKEEKEKKIKYIEENKKEPNNSSIKVTKNGVNIIAKKQVKDNEVKIILSFE